MPDLTTLAAQLADDVLFPRALQTDSADAVPVANLDALAGAGLYGIFAPPEVGGLGADFPTMCSVVEALASGCLTTAFVWVQHFGFLARLLQAPAPLRDRWLGPACRGERRGGIAFGGLLPGPPELRAEPAGDGWALDGSAPWVSGWGRIDTLHVAARGPDATVVHLAIDAVEGSGLTVVPQRLVGLNATATVRANFSAVPVPADRVLRVAPHDPAASGGRSLRLNGSLVLGLIRRCCVLMGPSPIDDELAQCRADLDAADDQAMPLARARAAELAFRAAAALMVRTGSRSIVSSEHAQRLAREALVLLVFGSRPEIKTALAGRLGAREAGAPL